MTKPADKWMQKAREMLATLPAGMSPIIAIARALEATDTAAREEERESLCTEYIDDFIVGVGFMDNLIRMLWKDHDIDISGDEQDKIDTLANLAERAAAIRNSDDREGGKANAIELDKSVATLTAENERPEEALKKLLMSENTRQTDPATPTRVAPALGQYGVVSLLSIRDEKALIIPKVGASIFATADELREAAHLFNQLAEYLESKNDATN